MNSQLECYEFSIKYSQLIEDNILELGTKFIFERHPNIKDMIMECENIVHIAPLNHREEVRSLFFSGVNRFNIKFNSLISILNKSINKKQLKK